MGLWWDRHRNRMISLVKLDLGGMICRFCTNQPLHKQQLVVRHVILIKQLVDLFGILKQLNNTVDLLCCSWSKVIKGSANASSLSFEQAVCCILKLVTSGNNWVNTIRKKHGQEKHKKSQIVLLISPS